MNNIMEPDKLIESNKDKGIRFMQLIKLHGSINWFRNRQKEIEEHDCFIYKRFDRYYENPNSGNNGVQFPYKLEIIIAKSPILDE